MIYNENGIILNEQYNLDYINEGLGDIANKVSRGVVKVLRAIMDGIANFIEVLQVFKVSIHMHKIAKNNKEVTRVITNDKILKSIMSVNGYYESNYNFKMACFELVFNNELSLEGLQKILYDKDDKIINRDEWFKEGDINDNRITLDIDNLNIDIRGAYSKIKVINSTITKKPIKPEVMNELHYYFINTIKLNKKYLSRLLYVLKKNNYEIEIKDDLLDYIELED